MFKLEFNIPKSPEKITLSDSICLMGSCFSDEIGKNLSENKFNVLSNPFGTIYNPQSIFRLIADDISENRIIQSQDVFYHWDAHGTISSLEADETDALFQQKRLGLQTYLQTTNWLVITVGTALSYEHKEFGVVANCHKVTPSSFTKRLLNRSEIIDEFHKMHEHLHSINPKMKIIFTVSPVRHIKDGLIENNRSKAILLDTLHSICEMHDDVKYFPSYEILVDELRDYRFYESDLIHPSKVAIEYIWKRFYQTYFNNESIDTLTEWNKIKASLNHKPFQPQSPAHQTFLKSTMERLIELNKKIDVNDEIVQIKDQIKKGGS